MTENPKVAPWPSHRMLLRPRAAVEDMVRCENKICYVEDSRIDLLHISRTNSEWSTDLNDVQLYDIMENDRKHGTGPRTLAFFVYLEPFEGTPYGYRSSLSRKATEKMFTTYEVADNLLLDMLGRPNYWSNVTREKPGESFEFICQHPRWRWDDPGRLVGMGHRAPCTTYMRHFMKKDLTVYFISSGRVDDWLISLRERIGIEHRPAKLLDSDLSPLAESPFMLHAFMSSIAFEHSMAWTMTLRGELMTHLKKINGFSNLSVITQSSEENQRKLDVMTEFSKGLHVMSQYTDSGIANANMSIRLCNQLLAAFRKYMPESRDQCEAVRETGDSLQYVSDSFECQLSWLNTYKARKDTAMGFLLNLVAQQDSVTNVHMAFKMAQDSSSMRSITILTMTFLPGTFIASLFSTDAFAVNDKGRTEITALFLPMGVTALCLTVVTLSAWYVQHRWLDWLLERKWPWQKQQLLGDDIEAKKGF